MIETCFKEADSCRVAPGSCLPGAPTRPQTILGKAPIGAFINSGQIHRVNHTNFIIADMLTDFPNQVRSAGGTPAGVDQLIQRVRQAREGREPLDAVAAAVNS